MISKLYNSIVATLQQACSSVKLQERTGKLREGSAPGLNINDAKLRAWDIKITQESSGVAKLILKYLPEGGCFIDIGANVGACSAQVIKARKAEAYLFEPVVYYYDFCCNRFRENSEVRVENLALSNETGTIDLHLDRENLGWNTSIVEKVVGDMVKTQVRSCTFDEFMISSKIKEIDVIKIDVEGNEFRVLEGMKGTIKNLCRKPVIICEVGWGVDSHPYWDREVAAFEWLFSNGYERINYDITSTQDLIFLPIER